MNAPYGDVFGFGNNNGHQIGIGDPINNPGINNWTHPIGIEMPDWCIAISAGAEHSLALAADGAVWICGVLLTSMFKKPVQVSGLKSIIAIAAGYGFGLALRADGTVWGWGVNDKCQLGDGTTHPRSKPVRVSGLQNIVAIAAGATHGLALDVGGHVWAWGFNSTGQLGSGGIATQSSPGLVLGNFDHAIAIAAGGGHSLALRADGKVWAWGANNRGQLGDDTVTQRTLPVAVAGITGIKAIAAGGE